MKEPIRNQRSPTDLKTSDFYYDLPEERIAQYPTAQRDASRLMVLDRATGTRAHKHFYDVIDELRAGDVLGHAAWSMGCP